MDDRVQLLPTPAARDWKGRNQRDDDSCLPGAVTHTHTHTHMSDPPGTTDWGPYTQAIRRWESIRGPAPSPVEGEKSRLSAAFVEWMMGLDAGWVTGVPSLSGSQQLKILGNGVVPQQAAEAWALLGGSGD